MIGVASVGPKAGTANVNHGTDERSISNTHKDIQDQNVGNDK
jgi:hypothetical protein